MSKQNKIILACSLVVVAAIIVAMFIGGGKSSTIQDNRPRVVGFEESKTMQELSTVTSCPLPTDKKYDDFAKCLTEKGAVMYGAAWCPHCKEQKAAFGDSFKYIKYVECPENTKVCLDNGVEGYPTWIIGTSTDIGTSTSTTGVK